MYRSTRLLSLSGVALSALLLGSTSHAGVAPPFPTNKSNGPKVGNFPVPKGGGKSAGAKKGSSKSKAAPKGAFSVGNMRLLAIKTDRRGKIQNIVLQKNNGERNSYQGCGVALSGLPHLAGALGRSSARVSIGVVDGCIDWYNVES